MIHVQIASQVTLQGVSGVRWVLVEPPSGLPGDAPATSAPAATAGQLAAGAGAATDPAAVSTSDNLRLTGLKALVIALGLGAALWTAALQVGPPGQRAAPHGAPAGQTLVPLRTQPVPQRAEPALPAAAEPAASAPARPIDSLPRLTAAVP